MNYRIQEKSNSDLSGIRVTEYINGNVSVSGSGSYADPWQFSDIISLHVNTTNKLRGRVSSVDCSNNSMKKETLYNNNITSLQEYIQLVEEWILFYNTTRLKSKVKKKRKTYTKREK